MATIVNTPAQPVERDSGTGFLLGIIVLFVLAVLFFLYVWPMIGRSMSGPQVNVPGKIDVNVQTPNNGGTGK